MKQLNFKNKNLQISDIFVTHMYWQKILSKHNAPVIIIALASAPHDRNFQSRRRSLNLSRGHCVVC